MYGVLGDLFVRGVRRSVLDRQDGEGVDGGTEGDRGGDGDGCGELPGLCVGDVLLRPDSPLLFQDAVVLSRFRSFVFLVCSFSFLLRCQFAFCEALLTSLKHISLLSNENSLKKTQNSPLKRNTSQNKYTLKHPTSSHTSCSTPSTAACPTSPFSRAPRGASPPPPGTARAAPSPPPGSDGPAR